MQKLIPTYVATRTASYRQDINTNSYLCIYIDNNKTSWPRYKDVMWNRREQYVCVSTSLPNCRQEKRDVSQCLQWTRIFSGKLKWHFNAKDLLTRWLTDSKWLFKTWIVFKIFLLQLNWKHTVVCLKIRVLSTETTPQFNSAYLMLAEVNLKFS
jgi:hypothetical protein